MSNKPIDEMSMTEGINSIYKKYLPPSLLITMLNNILNEIDNISDDGTNEKFSFKLGFVNYQYKSCDKAKFTFSIAIDMKDLGIKNLQLKFNGEKTELIYILVETYFVIGQDSHIKFVNTHFEFLNVDEKETEKILKILDSDAFEFISFFESLIENLEMTINLFLIDNFEARMFFFNDAWLIDKLESGEVLEQLEKYFSEKLEVLEQDRDSTELTPNEVIELINAEFLSDMHESERKYTMQQLCLLDYKYINSNKAKFRFSFSLHIDDVKYENFYNLRSYTQGCIKKIPFEMEITVSIDEDNCFRVLPETKLKLYNLSKDEEKKIREFYDIGTKHFESVEICCRRDFEKASIVINHFLPGKIYFTETKIVEVKGE